MAKSANTTTDVDLIVTLAAARAWLYERHAEIEKAEFAEKDDATDRLLLKERAAQMWRRIGALEDAIAAIPATSIEGALIQVRLIPAWVEIATAEGKDGAGAIWQEKLERLAYSAATAIERHLGIDRATYGGEGMAPTYCDPFNTSTTAHEPEEKAA